MENDDASERYRYLGQLSGRTHMGRPRDSSGSGRRRKFDRTRKPEPQTRLDWRVDDTPDDVRTGVPLAAMQDRTRSRSWRLAVVTEHRGYTMTERIPAQVFCLAELLSDEMVERGWTTDD